MTPKSYKYFDFRNTIKTIRFQPIAAVSERGRKGSAASLAGDLNERLFVPAYRREADILLPAPFRSFVALAGSSSLREASHLDMAGVPFRDMGAAR